MDALYELGASDPEPGMGGSLMADIVNLPECPAEVVEKALHSRRKHLVKLGQRKQLVIFGLPGIKTPPQLKWSSYVYNNGEFTKA